MFYKNLQSGSNDKTEVYTVRPPTGLLLYEIEGIQTSRHCNHDTGIQGIIHNDHRLFQPG